MVNVAPSWDATTAAFEKAMNGNFLAGTGETPQNDYPDFLHFHPVSPVCPLADIVVSEAARHFLKVAGTEQYNPVIDGFYVPSALLVTGMTLATRRELFVAFPDDNWFDFEVYLELLRSQYSKHAQPVEFPTSVSGGIFCHAHFRHPENSVPNNAVVCTGPFRGWIVYVLGLRKSLLTMLQGEPRPSNRRFTPVLARPEYCPGCIDEGLLQAVKDKNEDLAGQRSFS